MARGATRAVQALARGIDVLDLFLTAGEPLSVPEMAKRLGLPRSSVYELVQTLVDRRCLVPADGHPHRYAPGVHLLELGSAYAANLDLAREGERVAEGLARVCNETVHLAVLDGTDVIYLAKVESEHPVRMVSAVGRRIPAHCTAVGKSLLAGLSDSELAERYDPASPLVTMTPRSIRSVNRLKRELNRVRADGLAFDDSESSVSVRCVAAPVRDHRGRVVAAMSIAVPEFRMDASRQRELGELVRGGARELSSRLGYREVDDETTEIAVT
jgi:IclR family transcriptional regulator, KDG regulon repressor